MRFIDLFCGIGGFRIALETLGHTCVFSSEINNYAREVYKLNFGAYPSGDIFKIDVNDIPDHEILTAGFPCQSFSRLGKKKNFEDKRGQCFFEILRILHHKQPKIFILENVKGLIQIKKGKVLKDIITMLENENYNVKYYLLNSKYFSIPQSRERIYFVGIHKDYSHIYKSNAPIYKNIPVFLCDILENDNIISKRLFISKKDVFKYKMNVNEILNLKKENKLLKVGELKRTFDFEKRFYSAQGIARTQLRGSTIFQATGCYFHNNKIRALSLSECKKVMGFPEWYKLPYNNNSYKCLGNAVIPLMIEEVFKAIEGVK